MSKRVSNQAFLAEQEAREARFLRWLTGTMTPADRAGFLTDLDSATGTPAERSTVIDEMDAMLDEVHNGER